MKHKLQWPLYRNLVAFSSGLIFALGLAVSGMTKPENVLGFLNIFQWNPSLLLVMGAALFVHVPAYKFIFKRRHPFFDDKLYIPDSTVIDQKLILGAVIFGAGWGLGGYCPGPGIVSAAAGSWSALAFVIAMTVGMILHHFYRTKTGH